MQLIQEADSSLAGGTEGYERAYRALLDAQPEGRRFHKREALHSWGLALLDRLGGAHGAIEIAPLRGQSPRMSK